MSEPVFRQDHFENGDRSCALDKFLKNITLSTSPFQRVRMNCCYPQEIKGQNSHYLRKDQDFP